MSGQTYFLNGDAQAGSNGCYLITPNVSWQNGSVWYSSQLDLLESFTLEFYMNFGSIDDTGADGMVFVLQTVGTTAIGTDGGGMGFQGFNPSFGIEFDTFSNPETNDPNTDHIAFLRNGNINHNSPDNLAGPVQALASNINMEDADDHIVKINWNPNAQEISIYIDCVLRLTDQIDLVNSIFSGNNTVYWGFTGATGFYYNAQSVCLENFNIYDIADSTVCAGGTVQLAMSGNQDGEFSWSPALGLDDPASQTPVATASETTEYCCLYTDLCGAITEECITVFVENPPTINAGDDAFFCAGENVTLNAEIDNPLASLQWSSDSGDILSGAATLNPSVSGAGIYTLSASSPIAGCLAQDDLLLTETPLPALNLPSPVSFCPGEELLLDAGSGWDEILWSTNSNAQTILVDQANTYSLTVTQDGCSATQEIVVDEVQLPLIDLGPDQLICEDESILLDAGVVGTWSNGVNAAAISVSQSGDYAFVFTESGCSAGDEITISTQSNPVFDLGPDFTLCQGDTILLQIPYDGLWTGGVSNNFFEVTESGDYSVIVTQGPCQVTDLVHADMIDIPFIDLGPDPVYCMGEVYPLGSEINGVELYQWSHGEETPVVTISEPGDYFLTLENACGAFTDSIHVAFEECNYLLYVPTAFTPDGDGINDVFYVHTLNMLKGEIFLFNRWGDPVFYADDLDAVWTGDVHNGEYFAGDGVYTWLIRFTTTKGEVEEVRGHVTVLR